MNDSCRLLILEPDQALRLWLVSLIAPAGHTIFAAPSLEAVGASLMIKDFNFLIADLKDETEWAALGEALARYGFPPKAIFLAPADSRGLSAEWPFTYITLHKPLMPRDLMVAIATLHKGNAKLPDVALAVHEVGALYTAPLVSRFERLCVYLDAGSLIDCQTRTLRVADQSIRLSPTESRLLESLLTTHGLVMPYEDLVGLIYGYSISRSEAARLLRPVVTRLRHKLAHMGGQRWIRNQRQLGYSLQIAPTPGPLIE